MESRVRLIPHPIRDIKIMLYEKYGDICCEELQKDRCTGQSTTIFLKLTMETSHFLNLHDV